MRTSRRPALRASATIRDGRAPRHLAEALRNLAARSFGNEPGPTTPRRGDPHPLALRRAAGEFAREGGVVPVAFGGGPIPARPAQAAAGRLVLVAEPDALGALRDPLPPRATKALEGARRLLAVMPLPR